MAVWKSTRRTTEPSAWIGRRVDVQWNDLFVRLLDPQTGQLLREHVRAPRSWHRIEDVDRPTRTPPKTVALLRSRDAHLSSSAGAVRIELVSYV